MAKLDIPEECECDNTHEDNGTVCRFCWALGLRHFFEHKNIGDERQVIYTAQLKWPVTLAFDNSDNPGCLTELKTVLAENWLDMIRYMGIDGVAEHLTIRGATLISSEGNQE